jgi:hypothetical protein
MLLRDEEVKTHRAKEGILELREVVLQVSVELIFRLFTQLTIAIVT